MKLQRSKLASSCLLTATAMVLSVDQWWLRSFLDLPDPNSIIQLNPLRRRGLIFEDFNHKLFKYKIGFSVYNMYISDEITGAVLFEGDFDHFTSSYSIISVINKTTTEGHAVAWNGIHIFDSNKDQPVELEEFAKEYAIRSFFIPFEFEVGALQEFRRMGT